MLVDRAEADFVADMVEATERILTYMADVTYDSFWSDTLVQDAVIKNLQVLGEAVTHISTTTQEFAPNIPWRTIRATRNRIIHAYFGTDFAIIWTIITDELPSLLKELRDLLQKIESDSPPSQDSESTP